jgi:hypothetical protein
MDKNVLMLILLNNHSYENFNYMDELMVVMDNYDIVIEELSMIIFHLLLKNLLDF